MITSGRPRGSDEVSSWVGGALTLGALAAFAVVAAGVVLDLGGVIMAGLLLLVVAPIGQLLVALVALARARERRNALAAGAAMALLVGALALAAASATMGG